MRLFEDIIDTAEMNPDDERSSSSVVSKGGVLLSPDDDVFEIGISIPSFSHDDSFEYRERIKNRLYFFFDSFASIEEYSSIDCVEDYKKRLLWNFSLCCQMRSLKEIMRFVFGTINIIIGKAIASKSLINMSSKHASLESSGAYASVDVWEGTFDKTFRYDDDVTYTTAEMRDWIALCRLLGGDNLRVEWYLQLRNLLQKELLQKFFTRSIVKKENYKLDVLIPNERDYFNGNTVDIPKIFKMIDEMNLEAGGDTHVHTKWTLMPLWKHSPHNKRFYDDSGEESAKLFKKVKIENKCYALGIEKDVNDGPLCFVVYCGPQVRKFNNCASPDIYETCFELSIENTCDKAQVDRFIKIMESVFSKEMTQQFKESFETACRYAN